MFDARAQAARGRIDPGGDAAAEEEGCASTHTHWI